VLLTDGQRTVRSLASLERGAERSEAREHVVYTDRTLETRTSSAQADCRRGRPEPLSTSTSDADFRTCTGRWGSELDHTWRVSYTTTLDRVTGILDCGR